MSLASGSDPGRPSADSSKPDSAAPSRFRSDIEGLRAVAVGLVIANHAFHWPTGGYIGVDVFYVISGYLITRILTREIRETGTLSLSAFYLRRVYRILPAAIVVVVVTVAASYLVFYDGRADAIAADGVACLLFVANWHFARLGTDYLHAGSAVSPLQHYWSLSVEEQFYAGWPLVLLLIAWLLHRGRAPQRPVAATVLRIAVVIAVASLAWACLFTLKRPSMAYFDTFSRVFELLAGAIAGLVEQRWRERGRSLSPPIALSIATTGLLVLAVSSLLLTNGSPFPAPGALIPVLSSVMIIFGGAQFAGGPAWRLLTLAPLRYLGKISYSLYLWHFPAIILLLAALQTWPSTLVTIIALLVTFALSVLSYRHIETVGIRRRREREQVGRRRRISPRARTLPLIACLAFSSAIVLFAFAQMDAPLGDISGSAIRQSASTHRASPATTMASDAEVSAALRRSLALTAWPTTTPSLDVLDTSLDAAPAMDLSTGCRNNVGVAHPHICSYGASDSARTAVVIGDSIAASWMPTVSGALVPRGWRVLGLMFASCSPIEADAPPPVPQADFISLCRASRKVMTDWAASLHPDLVIVSSAQGPIARLSSGATGPAAQQEWTAGAVKTIQQLRSGGVENVLVLSNAVSGKDPAECATRLSGPKVCETNLDSDYKAKMKGEAEAARRQHAQLLDTRNWFCVGDRCPIEADGVLIRVDKAHLTAAWAARLAGAMRADLQATYPDLHI
ncbi:peptidoglycan/LPS O-acetylase OafA/YrhL [Jatrophihabitans sp. GAS493]|uniref:acyltransferase family protein n=1 Tax=Jatrophihabitans sp. GAS493 TaxID=1907575 RepID=UPI000BB8B1E5|nr:acyltransferase family protein [Jatrophihabitans sp. GAS493]SOD73416.1 peptidoglycan/LPS O-acetylase OafA/YrhL [Jatrophihabitans sp. GAS493]